MEKIDSYFSDFPKLENKLIFPSNLKGRFLAGDFKLSEYSLRNSSWIYYTIPIWKSMSFVFFLFCYSIIYISRYICSSSILKLFLIYSFMGVSEEIRSNIWSISSYFSLFAIWGAMHCCTFCHCMKVEPGSEQSKSDTEFWRFAWELSKCFYFFFEYSDACSREVIWYFFLVSQRRANLSLCI